MKSWRKRIDSVVKIASIYQQIITSLSSQMTSRRLTRQSTSSLMHNLAKCRFERAEERFNVENDLVEIDILCTSAPEFNPTRRRLGIKTRSFWICPTKKYGIHFLETGDPVRHTFMERPTEEELRQYAEWLQQDLGLTIGGTAASPVVPPIAKSTRARRRRVTPAKTRKQPRSKPQSRDQQCQTLSRSLDDDLKDKDSDLNRCLRSLLEPDQCTICKAAHPQIWKEWHRSQCQGYIPIFSPNRAPECIALSLGGRYATRRGGPGFRTIESYPDECHVMSEWRVVVHNCPFEGIHIGVTPYREYDRRHFTFRGIGCTGHEYEDDIRQRLHGALKFNNSDEVYVRLKRIGGLKKRLTICVANRPSPFQRFSVDLPGNVTYVLAVRMWSGGECELIRPGAMSNRVDRRGG
eukprot:gnl/Dysnectes_brevis/4021_a5248_905.p1 GENE.gnl/Dysnectes_brevis/4021_a5248_905~~gnl/Dysnectes_brevis/4021_a5248_905.p1  ORF type:complete len:407 (+),score=26.18 gnl/Dysnectes_brevis/4021_a5248_905:110-1330(+)